MHVDQQNQGSYLEKNVERSPFHDCHSFSYKWENETRDDWNEGKSTLGFIGTCLDTILKVRDCEEEEGKKKKKKKKEDDDDDEIKAQFF